MRLKIILGCLSFLIIGACGESPKVVEKKMPATEKVATKEETPVVKEELPKEKSMEELSTLAPINLTAIYGHYVGDFEAFEYDKDKKPSPANKINITIQKIDGVKVTGYSVVAGNSRPFEGTVEHKGNELNIEVKEPGDNRYDGEFFFTLNAQKQEMTGYWSANDKKLAVTIRKYVLEKRTFEYDPNAELNEDFLMTELYGSEMKYLENSVSEMYESLTQDIITYNASTTLLKKEEVENMYQVDLEVLRNAIYARHGYSFKNRRMRYLFDSYVDWYIPMKTNILADLTDLEKQNIELLKRYEQHAEKYYDVFGR